MHVISSPVLRGMKSIDQVKLFLTLREALIDSSLVVVIEHSPSFYLFCLSDFTVFLYLHRLSGTIRPCDWARSRIWLPNNLCIKKVEMKRTCACVCARAPMGMPCVQLHKYVFCLRGATNKAFKKVQSIYLNNYSLTRACTQTYTNPYIIHSDRATLNNMCTHPVLASPLLLHSREQMFGDSLQPQRISAYKANNSTQHFWL